MDKLLQKINSTEVLYEYYIHKPQLLKLTSSILELDLILGHSRRSISLCSTTDLPFEFEFTRNGIEFYGTKKTYQILGLCFLSMLFENKDYLELRLNSKKSIVPKIYLHYDKEDPEQIGLNITKPVEYKSFTYTRNKVDKIPFSVNDKIAFKNLPMLLYGWNAKNYNHSYDKQIEEADHLILSLNKTGICNITSLLLDFGNPNNEVKEICFESPTLGFGGVKENSLEMRFWLPNSFGFPQSSLESLDVNGLKQEEFPTT